MYPWENRQRRVSIKEMQNVVRFLRDHGIKDVVIPYSKLIMLPNDVIRTRRDRFKIIALIKSLVMLRQMSRKIFEKYEQKFIVAEWDDCLDVLESCGAVISQTVMQFSEFEVELIEKLQEWFGAMPFTVDDVQKRIPYSGSTVRSKLHRLHDKGAFAMVQGGGQGRKNRYELNKFDVSPFLSELKTLDREMVEEIMQDWRERLGNISWHQYDETGRLQAIS